MDVKLEDPFVSNPFCMLSLPANADGPTIRQIVERLRIEASLSATPESQSQSNLLTKAQSELLDSSRRYNHEILWFYNPPASLYAGNLADIDRPLTKFADDGTLDNEIEVHHDSALAALVEACHASSTEHVTFWTTEALGRWQLIRQNPNYTSKLFGDDSSIEQASAVVWESLLNVLSLTARRWVNEGRNDFIAALYSSMHSFGVDRSECSRVLTPAIEITLLEGQRIITDWESQYDTNIQDAASRSTFVDRATQLTDGLTPVSDLQNLLADLEIREITRTLEDAAKLLRKCSIALHNDFDDTAQAEAIIGIALSLPVSANIKEELQADSEVLADFGSGNPLYSVMKEAIGSLGDNSNPRDLILSSERLMASINDYMTTGDYIGSYIHHGLLILRSISLHLHNDHHKTTEAENILLACLNIMSSATDPESLLPTDEQTRLRTDFRTLRFISLSSKASDAIVARHFNEARNAITQAGHVASTKGDKLLLARMTLAINENSKFENSPGGNIVYTILGILFWVGLIWGCNTVF